MLGAHKVVGGADELVKVEVGDKTYTPPEISAQILRGLKERYETHHKLRYTDEALEAAVQCSSPYIQDRFLPATAIDLTDEAGTAPGAPPAPRAPRPRPSPPLEVAGGAWRALHVRLATTGALVRSCVAPRPYSA